MGEYSPDDARSAEDAGGGGGPLQLEELGVEVAPALEVAPDAPGPAAVASAAEPALAASAASELAASAKDAGGSTHAAPKMVDSLELYNELLGSAAGGPALGGGGCAACEELNTEACAICTDDIILGPSHVTMSLPEGLRPRHFECGHALHADCYAIYMSSHGRTCPICALDATPGSATASPAMRRGGGQLRAEPAQQAGGLEGPYGLAAQLAAWGVAMGEEERGMLGERLGEEGEEEGEEEEEEEGEEEGEEEDDDDGEEGEQGAGGQGRGRGGERRRSRSFDSAEGWRSSGSSGESGGLEMRETRRGAARRAESAREEEMEEMELLAALQLSLASYQNESEAQAQAAAQREGEQAAAASTSVD